MGYNTNIVYYETSGAWHESTKLQRFGIMREHSRSVAINLRDITPQCFAQEARKSYICNTFLGS